MKKATIAAFIARSNISAKLIRSTIRQIGGFDEFKLRANDVCNHGANGGFSGFIYYTETVAFTKRNKKDIMQYAADMANDIGESNAIGLIASFQCLKMEPVDVAEALYNPRSDERTNVFNALAWFALEEVSRAWIDFADNE